MPAITVIKHRRDTAANWVTANPVLAAGEIGVETDTNKFKFGNGTTAWNDLDYASASGGTVVSETPPADPTEGLIWFSSSDAKSFIYYDLAWVELSPAIAGPQGEQGPQGIQGEPGPAGPAGESGIPAAVAVSSNINLAAKTRYFVDTSVARTLTLPASPALGDEIQVFDATGTAGTNNITIANNSQKINGVLDSVLLDVNGVAAVFVYTGSTYGWRMG